MDTSPVIMQLTMQLAQSNSNQLPRYQQLYEALRQQILDGSLLPGTRLPSSRNLAKALNYSRNTVITALEQLCAEGYTCTRAKSGIYVLANPPTQWHAPIQLHSAEKLILSERGKDIANAAPISALRGAFAVGTPDLSQFPFALWQRYLTAYARNPKLEWLLNVNQGGCLELRQILTNYLRVTRGITCTANQILITSSTQHSLQLIADLLADLNDTVWIENPGYQGARCAFHASGLTVINQPVDDQGIAPPLTAWHQPPRLIYTTPSHQFPTGVIMSAQRRLELLNLAIQHQTWVIEDDYDSEFRYTGSPLAAMHSLAPQQVIYLGTFSKVFFPALKVSYMILPEPLIPAFSATQIRHLRAPSYMVQIALADFIQQGHASTHIRKMRREYQLRHDALTQLLQNKLGNKIRLSGMATGLHIVAYLPDHFDDQVLTAQARQLGITVTPLSNYYQPYKNPYPSGLVLGFGSANLTDITRAGTLLCQLIANYRASK